jgi:hypothetical protein
VEIEHINYYLDKMKFNAFENAMFNTIEERIEQCIERINVTSNHKIEKYRYGLKPHFGSTDDFIIEFYYDDWEYKKNHFNGFDSTPHTKIDHTGISSKEITEEQCDIINEYLGYDELKLYELFLVNTFKIKATLGKDYDKIKRKYYNENKWIYT